jgi:hypothetical protein
VDNQFWIVACVICFGLGFVMRGWFKPRRKRNRDGSEREWYRDTPP